MDWGELNRHWTTTVNIFTIHARKIGVMSAGILISLVAYGLLTSASRKPMVVCESVKNELVPASSESCPWQFVMSDLAHRLRLIEMAFKEQVVAREIIAAEVNNQTYSNLELERKLDNFTYTIKLLSDKIDKLSDQISEVSSRLYSDECLGFLVLVFVAGQVILTLRAKLNIKSGHQSRHGSHDLSNQNGASCTILKSLSTINTSGSQVLVKQMTSFNRQDVCLIGLNKSAWKLNEDLAETLVKCATDDASAPMKYCYVIDSVESLQSCPRAKLYIVLVDCSPDGEDKSSLGSDEGQRSSKLLMTLRHLRTSGGHVMVVMINENESQNLPTHSLYNTKLALIHNNDLLQELASNGRVLSLWKELSPNQLGHISKSARSLLSFKGK
ncbi:hypothetical protein BgiMline_015280 [Biomphalaria glabrata]|uniref:Uncharacterized protein LOC106079706 n=1 Tax=Biomphalaria glabrata TaxID=6526 RepID=A0A2C9LYX9_BIOGL|nr:uncharacterized protein LOC106079706 [Biomphalaria glabrata]KAI8772741.1 CAunnamed protein product [Biomphalaria glabrata]